MAVELGQLTTAEQQRIERFRAARQQVREGEVVWVKEMRKLATDLRALRLLKGWSSRELAKRVGMSPSSITHVELVTKSSRGRMSFPTIETYIRVAFALGAEIRAVPVDIVPPSVLPEFPHGTYHRARRGCDCGLCLEARRTYTREGYYRRRRAKGLAETRPGAE